MNGSPEMRSYASRYREAVCSTRSAGSSGGGGSWSQPRFLGTLYDTYDRIAFDVGHARFALRLLDGKIHIFSP